MKKMIFMLGAVLALTLVSFSEVQEKKVVKLRDGNYQVKNLDISVKKIISELAEFKGWKESKALTVKANEIELDGKIINLSYLEDVKGWEETAVVHKTSKTAAIQEKAWKDVVSKTIWRDKEFQMEGIKNAQKHIDNIMHEFN